MLRIPQASSRVTEPTGAFGQALQQVLLCWKRQLIKNMTEVLNQE